MDIYAPHIMDWNFVEDHMNDLQELYKSLADDESKRVMIAYLRSRLTGDVSQISECILNNGYSYAYDLLHLDENDIVVDGGAYRGDTILEMRSYLSGGLRRVYAFEPDTQNFKALKEQFESDDRIVCLQAGLHEHDGIIGISNDGTMGSSLTNVSTYTVPVKALDEDTMFRDVSLVKMDIEGSELSALRGMKKLIQMNLPNLAICIYHKNEDIVDIWNFFQEMGLPYRYYLRQHSRSVEETVLYTIHE